MERRRLRSLSIAALLVVSLGQPAVGHGIAVAASAIQYSVAELRPAGDAKAIRDRVNLLLNKLAANACEDGASFAERVGKAALTLADLRKFIRTSHSRFPYLPERDRIFLSSVESGIDESRWLPRGKLTSEAVLQFEIDLAEQFSLLYAMDYAIGDDGKLAPEDFRHDWARKVHSGLSCLRIPG